MAKLEIMDPHRISRTSSDWANWSEMENEGDGKMGIPLAQVEKEGARTAPMGLANWRTGE